MTLVAGYTTESSRGKPGTVAPGRFPWSRSTPKNRPFSAICSATGWPAGRGLWLN